MGAGGCVGESSVLNARLVYWREKAPNRVLGEGFHLNVRLVYWRERPILNVKSALEETPFWYIGGISHFEC
jgi:hypothetical protein